MTACKYTLLNKKGRNTHGFTLLEVMLAMAILAIALVAVFQSQSQSISMTNISRLATTAPLLAQSKMAEIEGMDPKNIGSGSGDFGDNFPDYSWRADVMETEISSFKKIEVTVINKKMVSNNSYQLVLYKFIAK